MSEVLQGVFKSPGLPDQYVPIAVTALGEMAVTGASGGGSAILPTTISCGKVTVGTSAAALPAVTLSNGVVLTADIDNTGIIYVGASGVTTSAGGYKLSAGQSISFAVGGTAAVFAIASGSGNTLYYAGN